MSRVLNRLAIATLVIGLLVGASVSYGLVSLTPSRTVTSTIVTANTATTATSSAAAAPALIKARVMLNAPFNGTTVPVEVNTTIGTNHSAPFPGLLSADYAPVANSSTASFSHYSGDVFAGLASNVPQGGENVTLTVSYGGHSGTGTARVKPGDGIVYVSVYVSTLLGSPPINTISDGASCGFWITGALWFPKADNGVPANTCEVPPGTTTPLFSLDIAKGITLLIGGGNSLDISGALTIVDHGTISIWAGNLNLQGDGSITVASGAYIENSGTINICGSCGIANYGLIHDVYISSYEANGVINNYGGSSPFGGGIINNPGSTLNNEAGRITNNGVISISSATLDNGGTIYNNSPTSGIGFNGGTFNNSGTTYNVGGVISWSGNVNYHNTGTCDLCGPI